MLSTMLAMTMSSLPDMLYDFHDSNAVLLTAIFVAMVKSTPAKSIDLADGIILLRMIWLIIVCGFSYAHLPREFRLVKKSGNLTAMTTAWLSLFFRTVVLGLVCIYNVWFWFRGIHFFSDNDACPTFAFFVARLQASGRLQRFYQATSIVLMLMPPG